MVSRYAREGSGWTQEEFLYRKDDHVRMGCPFLHDGCPMGDGGVTIPAGVQEITGRGTKCHGLVDKVVGQVIRQRLDMMIMEVFSNLNDSVILCKIISNES